MSDYFLEVQHLTKYFPLNNDVISRLTGKTHTLKAVDDISFFLQQGETLGLVGESGCGKSTTARLITRLIEPSSGTMLLNGEDLLAFPPSRMLAMRKTMQLVFQDPYSSLNPRKTVMQILSRPLEVHNLAHGWAAKRRQVLHLLRLVGMGVEHADRYPHEFSGGQRQRLAIARALAVNPQLVIGDEPVSALDVSIQAQILNLFRDLRSGLPTPERSRRCALRGLSPRMTTAGTKIPLGREIGTAKAGGAPAAGAETTGPYPLALYSTRARLMAMHVFRSFLKKAVGFSLFQRCENGHGQLA